MNANVHTTVGLATATGVALLVPTMQCDSIAKYSLCMGCAVIGALLPDIDANGLSKAKVNFLLFMHCLSVITFCSVVFFMIYFNSSNEAFITSITNYLISRHSVFFIWFIMLCIFGYRSKHRGFTHQFIGLISFTATFMLFTNVKLGLWFGVGFLSHQLIDMLNMKKIAWLYPLPMDFSLYLCKASGVLSKCIGVFGKFLYILFAIILICK